ncbi:lipid kinase [Geminicoccus roseus]|uniref:lipid kinase n=1 Tax=Geminicoccus roseus TaxID=404900 RepID=UPI0004284697|nr:lipid kinase [Geminicoccus roseus]
MPEATVLLLINPNSRRGAAFREELCEVFAADDVAVILPEGNGKSDPADLIREYAGQIDAVVVGGGDGSVHAALPGLLDTGLPLLVIPLGTANDLARALDLPGDPLEVAGLVRTGARRRIDLGRANGKLFVNVANMGLSVEVARSLNGDLKRQFGILAYPIAAWRALSRLRPFRAEIRLPDEVLRVRSVQLAVGAGRFYGGGMVIHEDARIDDGLLWLYSIAPRSLWHLFLNMFAWRAGRHRAAERTTTRSASWFEVHTSRSRTVTADGEIVTRTPVRFEVLPGALEVLVPPEVEPSRI